MNTSVAALDLDTVKALVNDRLALYCDEQTHRAGQLGNGYVTLWNSINSLLQAGGKRLRPYMLLTAYQAYAPNEPIEPIMPAALSQELIHLAMLVHDDIIDRDLIRYGVKNVTGRYLDHYGTLSSDSGEVRHFAESSAILAGDILLSDAYRFLGSVSVPQPALGQAIALMNQAVFEVVGGELLDTETALVDDPHVTARTIARFKTASYSFISPLVTGATLAGAPEAEIEKLRHLAENFGIAYQLRDDLLGVFGDEALTGKSTSSDIAEGKRTHLIEQFELLATEEQAETFRAAFHNPDLTDAELEAARAMLVESGAQNAVETEINKLTKTVVDTLESLDISTAARAQVHALIGLCLEREQ